MKKIVFFVSSFRAGGGEKQMVELANAFAARGEKVDLLVLKPVGPLSDAVNSSVRIVSLERRRILFSLFPLISYLGHEQPGVVVALDEYTHLLTIVARGIHTLNHRSAPPIRVVLRVGNMLGELFNRYEGKSKALPFLVRRLYKHADCIIANSLGVADDVILFTAIEPARVRVIYNPKPRAEILERAKEPAGHPWLDHKELPVVLGVGRLRVQKNFPLLIRAFAQVNKKIPARLVIIGTGREESRLQALVRELGLGESVSLPGYQENPYAFMSKADVFAFPSLWEGLPNALLEALVVGLPAIAADCPSGPREILAPETDHRAQRSAGLEYAAYGVLTAVGDEQALVEALTVMLSDNALRQKYAQAGRERSAHFDAQDIIGQYVEALGIA
jgi:glycosyltransferase involved in cell wall biosynthesis